MSGAAAEATTAPAAPVHWTFASTIDIAKVTPFFSKLIKLSSENYVAWARMTETALRSIKLFDYCDGSLSEPTDPAHAESWQQADLMVQGILFSNMEPEIIGQIDQGLKSADIWREIRRLFAPQTMADYTLTISNLINTKYVDTDQDVTEHVAKLKRYRRDLILMNRNLPDEVFACFLRLSMPSEWNYGLSDPYMSKKVEARIKGE